MVQKDAEVKLILEWMCSVDHKKSINKPSTGLLALYRQVFWFAFVLLVCNRISSIFLTISYTQTMYLYHMHPKLPLLLPPSISNLSPSPFRLSLSFLILFFLGGGVLFCFVFIIHWVQLMLPVGMLTDPVSWSCAGLGQVTTAAVSSWVQWPGHAWKTAFHSTLLPSWPLYYFQTLFDDVPWTLQKVRHRCTFRAEPSIQTNNAFNHHILPIRKISPGLERWLSG